MRISDWSSDVCSSDLPRGQTVAVVGESGSGKSTLARVITGLLPQSKGKVIFKGDALQPKFGDRSKLHLRQIKMLYKMAATAMNPRPTVRDIVGRPPTFSFGLQGPETTRTLADVPHHDKQGHR